MDEEKIEEMKEKRYLKSLDLLDLGRELRLAERAVERYKEERDESKAEELEEYCESLKRETRVNTSLSEDEYSLF